MGKIHFLNVKQGSCSIIEHPSNRTTVMDVCNAESVSSYDQVLSRTIIMSDEGIKGNFHQKDHPVNPIRYMKDRQINNIFRYIQSHPDMDHMDGIEALFDEFNPANFWDTANRKKMSDVSWHGSPYRKSDWTFYRKLRDDNPTSDPKRLVLYSGSRGPYYNQEGNDVTGWGDGLHILAPTKELVEAANKNGQDYNGCSYVILYVTNQGHKIIFAGDSHDETWNHILGHHEDEVTNIDLLIAPHHGRKSGRAYEFLNTLRPTLTFFGNAPSEHLAYDSWKCRNLPIVTNNQAGCMIVDTSTNPMNFYVTNKVYADRINFRTYQDSFKVWYVGPITKNLMQ